MQSTTFYDLDAISEVHMGDNGKAEIIASQPLNYPVTATVNIRDVPILAPALLCAAAAYASPTPPPAGTKINPCHLPVMNWQTGLSTVNGEPLLILSVPGGATLVFQFPPQAARDCGQALLRDGQTAGLAPGQQPH